VHTPRQPVIVRHTLLNDSSNGLLRHQRALLRPDTRSLRSHTARVNSARHADLLTQRFENSLLPTHNIFFGGRPPEPKPKSLPPPPVTVEKPSEPVPEETTKNPRVKRVRFKDTSQGKILKA